MNDYEWPLWSETFWQYEFSACDLNQSDHYQMIVEQLKLLTGDQQELKEYFFAEPVAGIDLLIQKLITIQDPEQAKALWLLMNDKILKPLVATHEIESSKVMSILTASSNIPEQDKLQFLIEFWQTLLHDMLKENNEKQKITKPVRQFLHAAAEDFLSPNLKKHLFSEHEFADFQAMILAPMRFDGLSLFEKLYLPKLSNSIKDETFIESLSSEMLGIFCTSNALLTLINDENFPKKYTIIKNLILKLLPLNPTEKNLSILFEKFSKTLHESDEGYNPNQVNEMTHVIKEMTNAFDENQKALWLKHIPDFSTLSRKPARDALEKYTSFLIGLIACNPDNTLLKNSFGYFLTAFFNRESSNYTPHNKENYIQILFNELKNEEQRNIFATAINTKKDDVKCPIDRDLTENIFSYCLSKESSRRIDRIINKYLGTVGGETHAVNQITILYSSIKTPQEKQEFYTDLRYLRLRTAKDRAYKNKIMHDFYSQEHIPVDMDALTLFPYEELDLEIMTFLSKCIAKFSAEDFDINKKNESEMVTLLAEKLVTRTREKRDERHAILKAIKNSPPLMNEYWKRRFDCTHSNVDEFLTYLDILSPTTQALGFQTMVNELSISLRHPMFEEKKFIERINKIGPYLNHEQKIKLWDTLIELNTQLQAQINRTSFQFAIPSDKNFIQKTGACHLTLSINKEENQLNLTTQQHAKPLKIAVALDADKINTIEQYLKDGKSFNQWSSSIKEAIYKPIVERQNILELMLYHTDKTFFSMVKTMRKYLMYVTVTPEEHDKFDDIQRFVTDKTYGETLQKNPIVKIWLPYSPWSNNLPKSTPSTITAFMNVLSADGSAWKAPMDFSIIARVLLDIYTQEPKHAKDIQAVVHDLVSTHPEFKTTFFTQISDKEDANILTILHSDNHPSALVVDYVNAEKQRAIACMKKDTTLASKYLCSTIEPTLKIELFQSLWNPGAKPAEMAKLLTIAVADKVLLDYIRYDVDLKEAWLTYAYAFTDENTDWELVKDFIHQKPQSPLSQKYATHFMQNFLSAKPYGTAQESQNATIKMLAFFQENPVLLNVMAAVNKNDFSLIIQTLIGNNTLSPKPLWRQYVELTAQTSPETKSLLIDTLLNELLRPERVNLSTLTDCLKGIDPHLSDTQKIDVLDKLSNLIKLDKKDTRSPLINEIVNDIELTWIFACYAFETGITQSDLLEKLCTKNGFFIDHIKFIMENCWPFTYNTYIYKLADLEKSQFKLSKLSIFSSTPAKKSNPHEFEKVEAKPMPTTKPKLDVNVIRSIASAPIDGEVMEEGVLVVDAKRPPGR